MARSHPHSSGYTPPDAWSLWLSARQKGMKQIFNFKCVIQMHPMESFKEANLPLLNFWFQKKIGAPELKPGRLMQVDGGKHSDWTPHDSTTASEINDRSSVCTLSPPRVCAYANAYPQIQTQWHNCKQFYAKHMWKKMWIRFCASICVRDCKGTCMSAYQANPA